MDDSNDPTPGGLAVRTAEIPGDTTGSSESGLAARSVVSSWTVRALGADSLTTSSATF